MYYCTVIHVNNYYKTIFLFAYVITLRAGGSVGDTRTNSERKVRQIASANETL